MAKQIDVSDLNIYYGSFLAVESVSMTIEPKAVTALIGPSGCGKSTFLRTLNRMHEVIPGAYAEGNVEIDGINIYGAGVDPVGVRRNVGMVFQRPNPFPTMSIRDNVIAGQKLNGERTSKSDVDDRKTVGMKLLCNVVIGLQRCRHNQCYLALTQNIAHRFFMAC